MQKLGISFFWLGKKRIAEFGILLWSKLFWRETNENEANLVKPAAAYSTYYHLIVPKSDPAASWYHHLLGSLVGPPGKQMCFYLSRFSDISLLETLLLRSPRHSPQKRLIQTMCFLLLTPSMSVSQHVPRESTQKKRVSSPSCVCCQCPLFVPLPVINLVFIAWENGRVVWERMKSLPVNVWTPCSIMMTHNNNRSLSVKQKKKKIGLRFKVLRW